MFFTNSKIHTASAVCHQRVPGRKGYKTHNRAWIIKSLVANKEGTQANDEKRKS